MQFFDERRGAPEHFIGGLDRQEAMGRQEGCVDEGAGEVTRGFVDRGVGGRERDFYLGGAAIEERRSGVIVFFGCLCFCRETKALEGEVNK